MFISNERRDVCLFRTEQTTERTEKTTDRYFSPSLVFHYHISIYDPFIWGKVVIIGSIALYYY
jgi:hypothetical protein